MSTFTGGTVNSDILPSQPGLNVGSDAQPWNIHAQDVRVQSITSENSPSADEGAIRLASTDTIEWRNADDTDNVGLTKDSDENLAYDGRGLMSRRFTSTDRGMIDPNSGGTISLAFGNNVTIRSSDNSGEVQVIRTDSSNRTLVGDVTGIGCTSIESNAASTPSTDGFLRLSNGEAIYWRSSANTANEGIFVDSGDKLNVSAINGVLLSGNAQIYMGGSNASFAKLATGDGGSALWSRLADNSDNADIIAKTVRCDGIQSNTITKLELGPQSASMGTMSLAGTQSGYYLVWYYLSISRAASSTSSVFVTFTWPSGDAVGTVTAVSGTLNSNTLGDYKSGTVMVRSNNAPDIGVTTTYASTGGTTMTYRLSVSALKVG